MNYEAITCGPVIKDEARTRDNPSEDTRDNVKEISRQDRIDAEIALLQRKPFQNSLARILGAEPTVETLKTFANKSPDRWGQLVAIFARLGGYHEKIQVDNVNITILAMSDAQIMHKLAELESQFSALRSVTPVIVSEPSVAPVEALPAPLEGSN